MYALVLCSARFYRPGSVGLLGAGTREWLAEKRAALAGGGVVGLLYLGPVAALKVASQIAAMVLRPVMVALESLKQRLAPVMIDAFESPSGVEEGTHLPLWLVRTGSRKRWAYVELRGDGQLWITGYSKVGPIMPKVPPRSRPNPPRSHPARQWSLW